MINLTVFCTLVAFNRKFEKNKLTGAILYGLFYTIIAYFAVFYMPKQDISEYPVYSYIFALSFVFLMYAVPALGVMWLLEKLSKKFFIWWFVFLSLATLVYLYL